MPEIREAAVYGARDAEQVANYLPANYEVCGHGPMDGDRPSYIIRGTDVAGWTLDDYVIPRLRSGNMAVWEIVGKEQ